MIIVFIRSGYKFLYGGLVAVVLTLMYYMLVMNNDIDGAFKRGEVQS